MGFLADEVTKTGFSPGAPVFPCHYDSANPSYSYFIHLPLAPYRHSSWQRR